MSKTAYAVEAEVPIPPKFIKSKRTAYPFASMSVGDSFYVPAEERDYNAVYSSAFTYGKRNKLNFEVRKVKGGTRVWRVE